MGEFGREDHTYRYVNTYVVVRILNLNYAVAKYCIIRRFENP